ncbi:hypothetical protein GCM10023187_39680 [Nibrella viscosa]|uniref:DUF2281 domain-containing protein n=1 Tax=Nibrella viscosa TaxID=1084524 RepID=A0ABP8KPC3_9BACT
MSELLIKYNSLDDEAKQEVADFIDFLLEKKGRKKPFDSEAYRQKLLNTSVWPEEEVLQMEENIKQAWNWKIEEF